jgi:hypothetical protein
MSYSADLIIARTTEIKLAELLAISSIASPVLFRLGAPVWKAFSTTSVKQQLWHCMTPSLLVDRRCAFRMADIPAISLKSNPIWKMQDFARSLSCFGSYIFSWGIPGAYDLSWVLAPEIRDINTISHALVRRIKNDKEWKLRGAIALDSINLVKTLWNQFGYKSNFHLVALENVCNDVAERHSTKLARLESLPV